MIENFGDPERVLIADETGFIKKGARSAGVQRSIRGPQGDGRNCQVGVFLVCVSTLGHALIDQELYPSASTICAAPRRNPRRGTDQGRRGPLGRRGMLPAGKNETGLYDYQVRLRRLAPRTSHYQRRQALYNELLL